MKRIIFGIAAIAVLAVGIIVLMKYKPQSGSVSERTENISVLELDTAERITISANGEDITLVNENGNWSLEGESEFSPQRVGGLAGAALSYRTDMTFDEIKPEYGLDKPDIIVSITAADGEHEVKIGRRSAVADAYFATADGAGFMLGAAQYKALTVNKDYLTSFSRIRIDPDTVTGITLVRGDETIDIYMPEVTRFEGNVWRMRKPYDTLASDTFIDGEILEKLGAVRLADKADGIGTMRATLTVVTDKDSYELKIGEITGGSVRVGYNGAVYSEPADLFTFVDADTFEFMNKLVSYVYMDDISSYTVLYNGKEYTSSDPSENKELYSELIGMTANGLYDGQPLKETIFKVKFNGAEKTAEYRRINAYTAAVTFDGNTIFTVAVSDVEELIKDLDEYFGGN